MKKTGSVRFFLAVVHSSVAKLLSDQRILVIDLEEQQEKEIAGERNPKQWKARSKGRKRK
jgi:hypothetical protein